MRENTADELEKYRKKLTAYCYRMLGSPFDAEDAVQETLVRAWRNVGTFRGESRLKTWLYRIATNVCLDMLKGGQRRAQPMDVAECAVAGDPIGPPLAESAWVEPIPDNWIMSASEDPADIAARRETVRLAFVAALQHLPPRQRAVLLLRDVLLFKANEVAELLDTTVASVNSALQRARASLKTKDLSGAATFRLDDHAQQQLLARYVDAFERSDYNTLVSLLHEDATMSMPPFTWWLRGREEIYKAWVAADGSCRGSRFVPVVASGLPAFGQYTPSSDGMIYKPWALQVVEIVGSQIAGITTFLNARELFPLFDLPLEMDPSRARPPQQKKIVADR